MNPFKKMIFSYCRVNARLFLDTKKCTIVLIWNKKIGFFAASYFPAEVTICETCYSAYRKVLDSISDVDNFAGD